MLQQNNSFIVKPTKPLAINSIQNLPPLTLSQTKYAKTEQYFVLWVVRQTQSINGSYET